MNNKVVIALIMIIVNAIAAAITAWLHLTTALVCASVFFFLWVLMLLKDIDTK